jgi:tetratricopeptide (TPR) repeat protein
MSRQDVRAVGGFAYGVVGADIHVFGDGTPVYLLLAHPDGVALDSAWMRAQPSRLLDARAEVVDFTGRDAEFHALLTWRNSKPDFAVRWLHGEGGQGKTRLAGRLAGDSERAGWLVVDAVHGTDSHPPAAGSQDLRLDGKAGVLLLVDYADRWSLSDLKWLFGNMLLRQSVPARVLLIGRSAGGLPAVRGMLNGFRENIDTSDQFLPPVPDDGDTRAQMFGVARNCFARHYPEVPRSDTLEPPGPLSGPDFGLTLALHMAALVAVDAAAHGRTPPTGMVGLTTYLLDREHENWRQLYENADRGLDYRTPDSVMARTVFTAILAGPATTTAAGSTILDTVMPQEPGPRILADHATCYPPADPATALQPLLPDRLAEDFLALMVPGHTISGFSPDRWATSVADLLLTSADTAACAPRTLTFLAAATDRWPHVGTEVLYPLVTDRPQSAVDASSPALTAIAAIGSAAGELSPDLLAVLEAVEPLLPEDHHVDLDVGTLEVAERLTAHRLAATADPAEHAWLYGTLGRRRSNAGRWEQALEANEHAARINRRLADHDPRYLPHLAMSLNNLANALSNNGRSREALAQIRQAVALHRDLAEADPRHRQSLAMALTNLGTRLTEQGLRDEGLTATEEAVAIRRALAAADHSAGHLSDLADVLINLSGQLVDLNRHGDAAAAARDAVDISRRLVEISPAEHLLRLAVSVNNLGSALLGLGRVEQALAAEEEAVAVYRRLAEANPATHLPGLVRALANVGIVLAKLERHGEALARTEEAVQLARQLADTDPALHRRDLARSLRALGDRLAGLGRRDDVLVAFREAIDLHDKGMDYEPEEVSLMRRLATMYRDLGDRENEANLLLNLSAAAYGRDHGGEAIAAALRAADIYRETGDRESEAATLTNLSMLLESEDTGEAIELSERVAAIYRELGQREFEAGTLSNLSSLLSRAQRYHDAVAAARRACELYRELGWDDGKPLFNLGRALLEVGETAETITVLQRAATIYRRTGKGEHEDSGRPWYEADTLGLLGDALAREGRFTEAVDVLRQSADLFETIGDGEGARKAMLGCCVNLINAVEFAIAAALCEQTITRCRAAGDREREAMALSYLGAVRFEEGRYEDGIAPCEQAVALFREVGNSDLVGQEAAALTNLGKIHESLRRVEESGTAYEQAAAKWREVGQQSEEHAALYGAALFGLGKALFLQHRCEEAARAFQNGAQICRDIGDRSGEANALYGLAGALLQTKGLEPTAAAATQAVVIFRSVGDRSGEDRALKLLHAAAANLDHLSATLLEEGRSNEAITVVERSVAAFHDCGDRDGEAEALARLGMTLGTVGRHGEAIDACQRAAAYLGEAGRREGESKALYALGESLLELRRFEEAVTVYRRCADIARGLGNRFVEGNALLNLGVVLAQLGRSAEASKATRRGQRLLRAR